MSLCGQGWRSGAGLALVGALFATAADAETAAPSGCRLVTIATATVRAVSGADIALEDGRTARLAGIEDAAEAELRAALPAGTSIILKRTDGGPQADRYGRIPAHVVVLDGATERWLQADLVARGFARASSRVGDFACAKELILREQSARAGKLGLWAEPYYVMSKAEDPAEVLKHRGRFALVEGRVVSVRESGGTIYVNFGRRWSEDFTVTIAKRRERVFTSAGIDPKTLTGRTVRIRGWIEERGGPWVEASRPEQIEVLDRN